MGASSLRAQEPQLMRSPGEPLQLNQRSFGYTPVPPTTLGWTLS